MAKKNIYSEFIKVANNSDFLSVQVENNTAVIINSHWIFSTPVKNYEAFIANNLKGFPIVSDKGCYRRVTKKSEVGIATPFNTARYMDLCVTEEVIVTDFIYKDFMRVCRIGNDLFPIADTYYRVAESLFSIYARGKDRKSPIVFENSRDEKFILMPINGTIDTNILAVEPVKAEEPTEIQTEPKAEEKPVEEPKAEAKQAKKRSKKQSKKAEPKNVRVERNEEHNGIEIYFTVIPKVEVRQSLKDNGFKWHNKKKCWFARASEKRVALAESLTR